MDIELQILKHLGREAQPTVSFINDRYKTKIELASEMIEELLEKLFLEENIKKLIGIYSELISENDRRGICQN